MNLNDLLQTQKGCSPVMPREEKILDTIPLSRDLFFQQEKGSLMSYWEFLWTQLQVTRKRWWALQTALLALACLIIPCLEKGFYRVRSIGVIGSLFVVFMIPELWRNKDSSSTQIEASCFYSLRQVYAARITLFGLVDVVLLTLFCFQLKGMGFTSAEVLSQFLLPATVTACICFSLLCGKENWGQTMTLTACLTWSGVWWLVSMNERLYTQVVPPVWFLLFALALSFLAWSVTRCIATTNQYWEVTYT